MVYIVVRRTVDWGDEAAVNAQLPPNVAPYVQLWNDTFALPYHEYRRRLKEIAHANHEAVEGAKTSMWDDVPAGSLVLPVDDDDWFAPWAATRLLEHVDQSRYLGYRWPARFLEVHFNLLHPISAWAQLRVPGWAPKHFCATNNYAISRNPELRVCLENHVAASRTFLASRRRVCTLKEHLSLMNRSLGSTTTFTLGMGRPDRELLLDRYRRYAELYRKPPRGRLAWAAPQIDAMSSLMAALRS